MFCRAVREKCACPLQGNGGVVKEDEEKSERTQPRQLTPQEALKRIHAARVRLPPLIVNAACSSTRLIASFPFETVVGRTFCRLTKS